MQSVWNVNNLDVNVQNANTEKNQLHLELHPHRHDLLVVQHRWSQASISSELAVPLPVGCLYPPIPATWKHGWSKHTWSKHGLSWCYLRVFWGNYARTIFTQTTFSRGRTLLITSTRGLILKGHKAGPESAANAVYEEFTRLAETRLAQDSLNHIKVA